MTPPPSSPAWARVRILLNLGDIPAATEAATAALSSISRRYRCKLGNAHVIGNPDVPSGWCYLNPRSRIAVVNLDVWDAHACFPAMHRFCDIVSDLTVPAFAAYDVRDWQIRDEICRMEFGV
jgi:hypothetical protein